MLVILKNYTKKHLHYYLLPIAKAIQMYWLKLLFLGSLLLAFEAGDSKYILDRLRLGYSVSSKKMFLEKLQEIENQPPNFRSRKKAAQDQEIKMNFKETVKEYLHFLFN